MEKPHVQEKALDAALCQFLFPFSLKKGCKNSLQKVLKEEGFEYFHLDKEEIEEKYYGQGYRVSHRNMERYYLPFVSNVLFPHSEEQKGFHRYSRSMDVEGSVRLGERELCFTIYSADVILCPFDLGFVTMRIGLTKKDLTYTLALEFIKQFSQLENVLRKKEYPIVCYQEKEYEEVESFLFKEIVPVIKPYLDQADIGKAYFETLPFFVDERMYVQAYFIFAQGQEVNKVDAYRAGQLNGLDEFEHPHVSANNQAFIETYYQHHIYTRWTPHTYFIADDDAFICLTSEQGERAERLAGEMYGEYYYSLLLNFFHKIVLLKLSTQYSVLNVDRHNEDIEELIRSITEFSSRYYFVETVSQTQGKEIFQLVRKVFRNDELYKDAKETLNSLFRYQDKFSNKRNNYLLLILTIYTVIGGIYGMNQVIEDLKGNIDWRKMLEYSLFEYIALFVTFSGLVLATVMGVIALARWMQEQARTRGRDKR